jgi:DNA-binding winged helix-turn-helix (wHTH) protein
MLFEPLKIKIKFLVLIIMFLMSGTNMSGTLKANEILPSEKINIALRRTADGLLRLAGDSTSRIPAIVQTGAGTWEVRIEQSFSYDQLPVLLQESFELHGILQPYDVTVKTCEDGTIDLGYNYLDFKNNKTVACRGREMPLGCHFIEVTFIPGKLENRLWAQNGAIVLLIFGSLAGFYFLRRQKMLPDKPATSTSDWIEFGNSKIDVGNQILVCNGDRQTLTFREAKLLMFFVLNAGKLLERDYIIQQVWADEGVLVGRSVDVFVSRLRKKLSNDPSLGISVVHGVGYRLETEKSV